MKQLILTIGLSLMILALVAGCSDDEENCPTCPTFSQTAVASGQAFLSQNELVVHAEIVGLQGQEAALDSVTVQGLPASLEIGMMGTTYTHVLFEDSTLGLVSGDTIEVRFYTPEGVSSARTKVLRTPDDGVHVLSGFQDYDSGATATFVWSSSPNADWYRIRTTFMSEDSTGALVRRRHAYVQSIDDTTFTIPGDSLSYVGSLELYLEVGTGADPSSGSGNITGGSVRGLVTSSVVGGYIMSVTAPGSFAPELRRTQPDEFTNHERL